MLQERDFIALMRNTETPNSLAAGLTDAQLGEVFEIVCGWVKGLARKGHYLRKRRT